MPNYNVGGHYYISIGMMYLSSYLKKQGFEVVCLNLNHYPPGKLEETLSGERYDVVATGSLFTYYAQVREVVLTTRRVSPKSFIVLGGALASSDPRFVLESLKPDALVVGEGELPMKGLLEALKSGSSFDGIAGLAFLRDGKFVETAAYEAVKDLDTLPWPDYEGFEFGRYMDDFCPPADQLSVSPHQERRMAPTITGRGCAARCTFCYRLTSGFRGRAVDDVIAEIAHLVKEYGINEINIWDDLFSISKTRIQEFSRKIKPLGIVWRCQLRVPVIDEETLALMKDSGCTLVSYGLESASPTVLKSMRKGISVAQMERALMMTRKAELTIQGNFIFGDPAETRETAEETLRFYRRHRMDFSNNLALGWVVPYPGSDIYRDLVKAGKIPNLRKFYETYTDENNRPVNMTSMPDDEWMHLITKTIPAEEDRIRVFGKVLRRTETRHNSFTIDYRCPLCGRDSEGLRLEVSNVYPRSSFWLACARCRQRSYAGKLDLMGPRRLALFYWQRMLALFWLWLKATKTYNRVRFDPEVDRLWNLYKSECAAKRRADPKAVDFYELPFLTMLGYRVRFLGRLLLHFCGVRRG